MRLFPYLPLVCLLLHTLAPAAEVTLDQDSGRFVLSNGRLTATVEKRTGRVTSVALGGRQLLGTGSGYWSISASSGRSRVSDFGKSHEQSVSIDPRENGGERAEVAIHFRGTGSDSAYPGTCEILYAMARDSTTLHATAVMSHGPGDAPFRIGEGRFVIKLDPAVFDHLTIDKDRNRVMPTGRDWHAGEQLNTKEARRLTTGIHSGWAEHKYSYSAMLGEVPAYGWLGSKSRFGVWMINPSVEYIAGGPTKMELTGHLDVGGEAMPTLLNMWHGSHYGGTVLALDRDEKWTKVVGPFALHFSENGSADQLWNSALKEAAVQSAAWPFPWFKHAEYPAASARGGVSGKLVITAPPAGEEEAWVGLTRPDYEVRGWRDRENVGWQRDGKNYQYWVKARPDGSFSLAGVRPGNYTLRAFRCGVLGEFAKREIAIAAGSVANLGDLSWTPERAGPTLWEIGIPDRGAAEFRNGDRYWHWGNYLKFRRDFPDGVDFTVGKSDWKKDWHVCQPLDLSANGDVLGASTWTIRFPLENVPPAGVRLRIAFCGSREGAAVSLLLNGSEIAGTGPLPENGAMHRDSHRGMWFERSFDFPANRLVPGENKLQLRLTGRAWHQGVLYDYIRMEEVVATS